MYKKMDGFAIVTGSAKGLGAGMIRQLAKEGYDVVINYVSESSKVKAEALAEEVRNEHGVGAVVFQGDVSKYEVCQAMVQAGIDAFGDKIAVLVNNAGVTNHLRFEELTHEQYERLIGIELMGSMHCTHVVLPYMQKAKDGCILFTSSVAGFFGQANEPDYTAAKAAMHGFARALARENAENNVRVNCIAPGLIWTDIFNGAPQELIDANVATIPMKRFGEIEDIAECMSYIINAKYVTGQIISPNGGVAMY